MASRNIGTLSIDLIAKTAGFKEGMTAAERQLNKIKSTANKLGDEIARLGKRFAAAVAGIAAFVAVGFKLADQMSETAEKLGLTTEALAGLQHAAAITGVATSELESGLVKMTKAVSEAARGTGSAQKAFAQLGLDAKALNQLSPDEQFRAIAEAMEGVGVQGDKLQLVMKIFKDADLVRTLALGAKGLDESAEAAERFGNALNAVQVDEIDQADAALETMRKSVEGLAVQMAAGFAPAIAQAAEDLTDFVVWIKNTTEAFRFMDEAFLGFEHDVRSLNLGEIGPRIELVEEQIADLNDQIKEHQRLAPQNVAADAAYTMQLQRLQTELAEATKRLEELTKRKKQFNEAEGIQVEEISINIEPGRLDKLKAELDVLFDQKVDAYNKSLEGFADRFATAEQRAEALRQELEKFRPDLANNPDAIANAEKAIFEELTGGLEEIEVNIPRRISEPFKKAVDEMTQYAKQAQNNMQDALAAFLFDPFEDGLKGMLKSFVDTLRQMAANMAAAQIFSLFGAGGAGRSFLEGLLPGRAAGGPVMAGHAYTVGERGAETFIPSSNGRIVPNTGQPSVNITQNNYIEGSSIGPEQMANILNENNRKLKGEFLQELRRGTYS